jgi:hypothetical protein
VSIGFGVVPEDNPASGSFWPTVAALGGSEFAAGVDYVGLDMYPDVFGGRVDSSQPSPFLRDDYTPKPAFERLRETIAELRRAPVPRMIFKNLGQTHRPSSWPALVGHRVDPIIVPLPLIRGSAGR